MHKIRAEAIARIKREVGISPLLILEQAKMLQATWAGSRAVLQHFEILQPRVWRTATQATR
jgi:hypothetical protein